MNQDSNITIFFKYLATLDVLTFHFISIQTATAQPPLPVRLERCATLGFSPIRTLYFPK
jgi:hypothetical protein